jgi:thiamine-phosphate pyrophosphorylase
VIHGKDHESRRHGGGCHGAVRHTLFTAPSVYPIIDTDVCERHGILPVALAEACLRGGATVLQLRQKAGTSAAFLDLARRVVAAARAFNAVVIINDRADIAALAEAAGVHIGQDDLGVEDVRSVAGPSVVVGLSTHGPEQIDAALRGNATYVAVGPVYGTETKDTGYSARGIELIRYASGRGKPVVAIGGITLDRVMEPVNAGASGLAVISDLLSTGDPEGRVRDYVRTLA